MRTHANRDRTGYTQTADATPRADDERHTCSPKPLPEPHSLVPGSASAHFAEPVWTCPRNVTS
jgi:hypothetical protein